MKSKSTELPIPGSSWRGLTLQFFVWVIVPIILLLFLATFGSFTLHQREMREMVGVLDERTVQTAASSISEQIENRASIIEGLSILVANENLEEDVLISLSSFTPYFESGIAIFSPSGDLLEANQWSTKGIPESLAEILTEATTEASISSLFINPESAEKIIFIAASNQNDAPIVVGAFKPSSLVENSIEEALGLKEQASITLIDLNGQVLFTSKKDNYETLSHFLETRQNDVSGFDFVQDDDQYVLAYSSVSRFGWTLILEEPWTDVATPTLTTTLVTPLALTPVLLLALIALWYGAKKIVQPLQNLENRARDLAWGNFKTIHKSVGGIKEIVLLQNTLVYLAKKVQISNEGLRGYIGAITLGQEDERRRLARELHDETIQTLIALNQRVQLAQLNNNDQKMSVRLTEIENISQEIIRGLRLLTQALRPFYLDDLGLVAALKMLVSETNKTARTSISFQYLGLESRPIPETELALYRLAQEGINNIIRHAEAEEAHVKIIYSPTTISLIITDNGIGFTVPENPAGFAPGGHFGILGMFERAELVSAKLEINSKLEEGTEIVVIVPYKVSKA